VKIEGGGGWGDILRTDCVKTYKISISAYTTRHTHRPVRKTKFGTGLRLDWRKQNLCSIFLFCWRCILLQSLQITNLKHIYFSLYLFILILYMFRATKCSSSGESIVSIRPLVYATVCRWPCGLPGKPPYHTVTYIEWHTPKVVLIQLTLLMMSTWLPETCRELK